MQHVVKQYLAWRVSEIIKNDILGLCMLSPIGFTDCRLTEAEFDAIHSIETNSVSTKDFKIVGEVFRVKNSHNILKSDVIFGSGNVPYVTASEGNNSIVAYISYDENEMEDGNVILIGGKTLVITYQPQPFFSNDSHNLILQVLNEDARDESTQLYLVTALYKSLSHKYSWGNSISKQKIQSDTINLPVSATGQIDYALMRLYIRAIRKQLIGRLKFEMDRECVANSPIHPRGQSKISYNTPADIAAEPYEVYTLDGYKQTVLIGCYKDKKHLEWILSNNLYNIRLGKRKGSMESNHKCFGNAKVLYLYDLKNPAKTKVFNIKGNNEMTGEDLKSLDYPRKAPGKSYMTFNVEAMSDHEKNFIKLLDINDILNNLPNHKNGTPVFIQPEE